jgi:hypothetical protein
MSQPGPAHRTAVAVAWLLLLLLGATRPAAAQSPSMADSVATTEPGKWPYTLPFLADMALERGYQLPLPLGISGVFTYVERDIDIDDIRVGINGAPLRSVSHFIDLGSRSHVSVALARFDAWLLPFLNVYAMAGYVSNKTTTSGEVTVPRLIGPGTRSFKVSAKTELDGFVGGGGLTLAGGYRQLFFMGDANYSQTDIGFDDRFRALLATVRVGWNGKILDVPTRLWVGGMYWGTHSTARATIDVPDVGGVKFEADQGPAHPFNPVVGATATLFRRWDLFVEYGFNTKDMQSITAGLTFRF